MFENGDRVVFLNINPDGSRRYASKYTNQKAPIVNLRLRTIRFDTPGLGWGDNCWDYIWEGNIRRLEEFFEDNDGFETDE